MLEVDDTSENVSHAASSRIKTVQFPIAWRTTFLYLFGASELSPPVKRLPPSLPTPGGFGLSTSIVKAQSSFVMLVDTMRTGLI